jgi:hypothetical protein
MLRGRSDHVPGVRVVICLGLALGAFVVVNEIGPYKRHGGPILFRIGRIGAVHAGDLVVLGLGFVVAMWGTKGRSLKPGGGE